MLPIPRLKKMVELMLQENPKWRGIEVRNSDMVLTIVIWQRWYNVSDLPDGAVHLYRLLDLPSQDNVKRVRAHFQNDLLKYLPTSWAVAKQRKINRDVWERELGYKMTPQEVKNHYQTVSEVKHQFDHSTAQQGQLIDIAPERKRWI
jgi:hypothetical protein